MRITLAAVLAVCVLTWACGSDVGEPTFTTTPSATATPKVAAQRGWVYAGPDGVVYIQWTDDNGELAGQFQAIRPGDESPETQNVSFDGVLSGDQISLRFDGGTTWTGTLDDHTLTLVAPSGADDGRLVTLVMTPGSVEDYNGAVDVFRREQASIASASATAQALEAAYAQYAAEAATATAEAQEAAAALAFAQAVLASGVKYKIITAFEESACPSPYTSYEEKAMYPHAWAITDTTCVNLNTPGTRYQGRAAWYVMPADGCPEDAYAFEPYGWDDFTPAGPIICIDGVLLEDAEDLAYDTGDI